MNGTTSTLAWAPAALMAVAAVFTVGIDTQRTMPLRQPLGAVIPADIAGFTGRDVEVSEEARRVAGMTTYLMRVYDAPPADAAVSESERPASTRPAWFSVYVGYYARQTRGRTIHSPKNCLPGAGWEALASRPVTIATPAGPVTVNQYLLQRGDERALVLYWYQGRGRVESNEYMVKWDLLRDAALRGRSEEALVRVMVPVNGNDRQAFQLAANVAGKLVPRLYHALPAD